MAILQDVADGIKLVADTIKNLKVVYTAVRDGKQYFDKKYPSIKADLVAMCEELYKTCDAVAKASGIITNFKFNHSPGAIHHEPTRFNDYFIKYKADSTEVENLIRSLKGSCTKISYHINKLNDAATNKLNTNNFLAFFGLHSHQRSEAVRDALDNIYNEEKEWYFIVGTLSKNITTAIRHVSDVLGDNGMMHSSNIPAASQLLSEYAQHFRQLELQAQTEAQEINELIEELNN